MAAKAHSSKTYTLRGSPDNDNIERRLRLLSTLFETAKTRCAEIAHLRQNNLSYALVIFAGLFTFGVRFPSGWYSVWVSAALFVMMCFFSLLDRRFHRYIHGWRETEKIFVGLMESVTNDPNGDITFVRYVREGERKAEKNGLQPWITYLLVIASAAHLTYCFIFALKITGKG
jgi:hypothetical protein